MIFFSLENYGILNSSNNWQLTPYELQKIIIQKKMGVETKSGVLAINTGFFTGRSPDDRFIVKDSITEKKVWWDEKFNQSFDSKKFDCLYQKVVQYLSGKTLYIRDGYLCSDKRYQLNVRSISEYPWSDLFIHNLFFRFSKMEKILPDWLLLCAPGFQANPAKDGTRKKNFSILNFSKKIILIGGSGYTGEIKKSIFSVLNFILPMYKNVFPMHCSANVGKHKKDTALFFGLSGTGKTTISNDINRNLVGDDEHGWTYDNIVFNFEGGCYAKILGISRKNEPMIYSAIRKGAMLENVILKKETKEVDFLDDSITQNIRISYPIYFVKNIEKKLLSSNIRNIFFLTYDAFGVFPPIAKLNRAQSSYYFLLGYTSKVAGTELNIHKPKTTFSSCFGAPFMPLHPVQYTKMLMKKLDNTDINVWMVNTGLISGEYSSGHRIKLNDTRKIVQNVLNGFLSEVPYEKYPIFNFQIPKYCPGVSSNILNPKNSWKNEKMYQNQIKILAKKFIQHFDIYRQYTDKNILSGEPILV
ncbi:phosphoenolpyruvate carboxykinase (ATP) [Blattabacterium cuenoti]|uniref:phosphoenolpyruvate carboxykinase (ATP) n=1 Tax=Blattabacterium cuenoti TaxID=1653831 RepID=UPI00163C3992|nr:phosphoenolpyruvate carboxykinase (ATP) [Blattabacterium cuenoti]